MICSVVVDSICSIIEIEIILNKNKKLYSILAKCFFFLSNIVHQYC